MEPISDASPTDEELVERFAAGDDAAFDAIVLRHRKEIYRIAYRLTGNHAESDDLAQETFCRAYTALGSFRGESSLRTWLCRIAGNLSLNVVSSARVSRHGPVGLETLAEAGHRSTVQPPVGADGLIRSERDALLRKAIGMLPRRQRLTLRLRAFEGMAYKEIAQMMGCSIGTAKANFFHAVARLRRELQDQW